MKRPVHMKELRVEVDDEAMSAALEGNLFTAKVEKGTMPFVTPHPKALRAKQSTQKTSCCIVS